MSRLPDALLIGPMKGGSTWIHDYLSSRGDVCLPAGVKETFFFDRRFDRGTAWYERHFDRYEPGRHRRTMELAPSYFHSPEAPERVRSVLGDVPLVVTVRDPIKRAWSHYLHLRRYGYTRDPLPEAAEDFPELLQASRYAACLERWQSSFGTGRLHILWQEVLASDPERYASELCAALDLPFEGLPEGAQGRSYEAAAAPVPWLAALGRRASYALRGRGFHGVVNVARRSGLYRLFFGSPGGDRLPELTGVDAEWLRVQLEPDFRAFARSHEAPSNLPFMAGT